MKVSIDLPEIEGFEIADGKQPRKAKSGDWCMHLCSTEPFEHKGLELAGKLIILKKKAPIYETLQTVEDGSWICSAGDLDDMKWIEIKALKDAFFLIDLQCQSDWSEMSVVKYKNLKELL